MCHKEWITIGWPRPAPSLSLIRTNPRSKRRTMILRILIALALLVAVVLAFAATKPSTLLIQRSIIINAPPDRAFALINDLHAWQEWDPDGRKDATVSRSFSGAPSGVGAAAEWDSQGSAGKGRMLITESEPPRRIAVKVDFVKP